MYCDLKQFIPASKSRASGSIKFMATYDDSRMEMVASHDRFCIRLTKFAHFIPVRTNYSLERLVELYISKIIRLHGVPLPIISDRDLRFTFSPGYEIKFQYSVPSLDRQAIRMRNTDTRRHVTMLCNQV
ncbi:Transposon Ty3-I Gag-Pol polyprotein [Gossypium australe]|uniref:Transposon Ty3-I Gag-Pol polyprotein n=1 Tax=Gossypium australe TaxID=47621 RepID=A0A5B6VNK7_9ROSI|nr:Transposon Ty3-I Gag-Pol polyprotein [Gossypium australe]